MTLGCGGYGGNITSDNISPRHLLNIKRLAYEINPVAARPAGRRRSRAKRRCPKPPRAPPVHAGHRRRSARQADRRVPGVARIRRARRERRDAGQGCRTLPPPQVSLARAEAAGQRRSRPSKPLDFVCEDDVRQALRQGRKIVIGEETIVTPAARDFGEQHQLFVTAGLAEAEFACMFRASC